MIRPLLNVIALFVVTSSAIAQPALRKQGTATQLVVDGAPFLILGGELGNSTASSVAGMRSMFANAALIRLGYQPGRYVSAGPLPHLADVWRANAPSLDFIAPDIYFPNFTEWSERYATKENPL